MTNASGPDGITVRLLRDAAPVITTLITYLVNLTISNARVTPTFKSGTRNDCCE